VAGIKRHEIRAVVRDGVPCVADPDFAGWFEAAGVETVPATLDGRPKLLARTLAHQPLIELEPGLELDQRIDKTLHEPVLAEGFR
jgi:hypothetical protein